MAAVVQAAADRPLNQDFDGQPRSSGVTTSFPNLIGEPQATMLTGSAFRGTPTILRYDADGRLRAVQADAVPVDVIGACTARHSAQQG